MPAAPDARSVERRTGDGTGLGSCLGDQDAIRPPDGGTARGTGVAAAGSPGKEPGHWARPHGMAMDSKGYVYVADAGNERVQKFEVPASRRP